MHQELLKPSRYNILHKDKDGYDLIMNSLSGGIIRVDSRTKGAFLNIVKDDVIEYNGQNRFLYILKNNGFLIPESFNELEFLRDLHEKARNGEKALGIGISPTLNCNFRCVYCFEDHAPINKIDMPKEIQDSIVKYVEKRISGKEVLYVDWFGGEPLLKIKLIKLLSQTLMKICNNNNCQYKARITTNGYYLTPNISRLLNRCLVQDVQVTFDGPKEIHDKRRILKSGKGTFEKILNNIMKSSHLFDNFWVRINIDKSNSLYVQQLFDILEPVKDTIALAFRSVNSPGNPGKFIDSGLSPIDYRTLEYELIENARERGFKAIIGFAYLGTTFCAGYQRNAIMVDPHGDVHLCPACVGRREIRYGMLNTDGDIIGINGVQSEWSKFSPLDDHECRECLALPLCMGGCLWYLQVPKNDTHRCRMKYNICQKMERDCALNKLLL